MKICVVLWFCRVTVWTWTPQSNECIRASKVNLLRQNVQGFDNLITHHSCHEEGNCKFFVYNISGQIYLYLFYSGYTSL